MENATEALKMAFAVLVFVMAMTAAFMLVTQARSTADVIFTAKDEQDYVKDITSIGQEKDASGNLIQYRIVGIDTIVPTIYRYAQENYGVIIIDNKKIVAIYDLVVENTISKNSNKWKNNYTGSSDEINEILGIGNDASGNENVGILDYVQETVDSSINWDENEFKKIFGGINISDSKGIYKIKNPPSVSCPWTSSTYNIMQRIKTDMHGGTYDFGGTGVQQYQSAFFSAESSKAGFIKKYQGAKFKEYYYTVKATNQLTDEEETDRIQIIYVKE